MYTHTAPYHKRRRRTSEGVIARKAESYRKSISVGKKMRLLSALVGK